MLYCYVRYSVDNKNNKIKTASNVWDKRFECYFVRLVCFSVCSWNHVIFCLLGKKLNNNNHNICSIACCRRRDCEESEQEREKETTTTRILKNSQSIANLFWRLWLLKLLKRACFLNVRGLLMMRQPWFYHISQFWILELVILFFFFVLSRSLSLSNMVIWLN